mgnify:CR=1 FL=1
MGIAALIIGILGLLGSAVPFVGIVLGIAAIILGILGRKRLLAAGRGGGVAVGGVVTGSLGFVAGTAMTVACLAFGAFVSDAEESNPFADLSSSLPPSPVATASAAPAAPPAPSGRTVRCDLSSAPARQCTEYRLGTAGSTEATARSMCNLSQIVTPEAQRVQVADGSCPTANAIARCQPRFGSSATVYYRDPDPGIDNEAAMGAMEGLCTGTFTRL